ncbi:Modification methylase DpnIIB [compost metagenome]
MTDSYGSYTNFRNDNKGMRYPKQVIEFGVVERGTVHPTQKPVELMEYLIRTYTNDYETVLDFTTGSGSTGVACMNTNRKFIGIELDENYFDIAKERILNV